MTTPSSCKSFFKPYLIYKLRTQSVTFIISALFNLLTLPLTAVEMLIVYNIKTDDSVILIPDMFYWLSVIVLFGMAITGGARAFRSCVKKDTVDTLTALPLTRREQFTADILSGYIANVGPFLLCALIAMIISIPADNAYFNYFTARGDEPVKNLIIVYIFFLAVGMFLLYTLSYILSVFTTVCCGKISSSIIFTAVISGLTMIGGMGIGSYAEQCITGLLKESTGYYNYIPPIGLINFVFNWFYLPAEINLTQSNKIPTPSVWGIILLIIAGAAVTYVSYRIYKNRQPERTGKAIASNTIYRTMCALGVIAVTSVCMTLLYTRRLTWLAILIALGITAVAVLILEAIRGFKKTGIMITGTRCVITLAVCVIALVIVDKTGVFGARYINKAPSDVECIYVSSGGFGSKYYKTLAPSGNFVGTIDISLTLDDQDDIKEFLDTHNKLLKQHGKDLNTGFDYEINVILKDGENIHRCYRVNHAVLNDEEADELEDKLDKNLYSLPNYNAMESERYSQILSDKRNVKAEIKDAFGDVEIPDERLSELFDVFTREFKEKFTPTDTTAGIFIYKEFDYTNLRAINIPNSCTETLALINSFRSGDPETTAFNISITTDNHTYINYPVTVKEAETELGRELLSLMTDELIFTPASFREGNIEISSTDVNIYYINQENYKRAFEIVMQLMEEKYLTGAQ